MWLSYVMSQLGFEIIIMHDQLVIIFELTVCEVIFGIPTNNNSYLKIINFLILIGKWYLNNSKTNNKNIYFIDFITLIKAKIDILKYIHASKNEEADQWVTDLWAAT